MTEDEKKLLLGLSAWIVTEMLRRGDTDEMERAEIFLRPLMKPFKDEVGRYADEARGSLSND
jgi:hypothetical protein